MVAVIAANVSARETAGVEYRVDGNKTVWIEGRVPHSQPRIHRWKMGGCPGGRSHQGHQCVRALSGARPRADELSVDPSTEEDLGTVPEMGLAETKQAIDAAARAFKSWGKTTAKVENSRTTFV